MARRPLLVLLVVIALPGVASADTVTVRPVDAPVGVETTVTFDVEATQAPLELTAYRRSASGPPCDPSSVADYAATSDRGETPDYLSEYPLKVTGSGAYTTRHTFGRGRWRICAWLQKSRADPEIALGTGEVASRNPRGQAKVDLFLGAADARGAFLGVRLSGRLEGAANIRGQVARAARLRRCASRPPRRVGLALTFPLARNNSPLVEDGSFKRLAGVADPAGLGRGVRLGPGRWRVCAWLVPTAPGAEPFGVGTDVITVRKRSGR